jgi:N-acetylneuraminate synthase
MIKQAKMAGATMVKIQKRTPILCVPEAQRNQLRDTPWGILTYLDYKNKIEFSDRQIRELVEYADSLGVTFFASVWDIPSAQLMAKYTQIGKIPSALITNLELCRAARELFSTLIISTGMSTEEEVIACVEACRPDVIMHTNSTYPCPPEIINLRYLQHLKSRWPDTQIGYSGHEQRLAPTLGAVSLGATWIERHVTTDPKMWGSDQSSSLTFKDFRTLVEGIRDLELALQYPPGPRVLFDQENTKRLTLRG